MSFRYKEVINLYQAAYEHGQKTLKSRLQTRYAELVSAAFDDVDMVQFPALGRIMRSAAGLSFDPQIGHDYRKTREVKIGTKEVMDRRLFNPVSWFKAKTVNVYDTKVYIDLAEFYKEESVAAKKVFNNLREKTRTMIDTQAQKLLDVFVEHVRDEFEPRVNELLGEASARIEDRELRAAALAEASELRRWSEELSERLRRTLDIEEVLA